MISFSASEKEISDWRSHFPILGHPMGNGKDPIYLDNAVTTFKPQVVVDALNFYNEYETANIHRGVYYLSEMATEKFEKARLSAQKFLNAKSEKEIIFTRGTTEGLNLVAQSYGRSFLKAGDEIVITHLEHHSNIVPWQILGDQIGTKLKVVPINDLGEVEVDKLKQLLGPKTKIASFSYVSNALGSINPVSQMIKIVRELAPQAKIIIDAAQAVAHLLPEQLDVQKLDCDFMAFSGHKIYGPTGIGILYGKESLLEQMPPWQGGGDMIESVSFEKTTWNQLPYKFEAGTPSIAEAIGLGAALKFYMDLPHQQILKYEDELRLYAEEQLVKLVPGLHIIGRAKEKCSIISFVLDDVHPHDIGTFTGQAGIAIRTGHHCAQPVMTRFKVPATARASFSFYNKKEEIDLLCLSLKKTVEFFQ